MSDARAWALILAAGEGSRLRTLTTTASGLSVPKQFCSLRGGRALLEEAVRRASAVAPLERICLVVAAQHRRWWAPLLDTLPPENVIEQPENRGTAYGILLPLLQIAACDSAATVVVFPADHYVRDEAALAIALREAVAIAGADRDAACLLGVEPDEPDTELGYIVPAERRYHRASAVVEFIEKPFLNRACALLDQGALWNVFILASSAKALLALYESRFDSTIARLRAVIASCRHEPLRAAATALREHAGITEMSIATCNRSISRGTCSKVRRPLCGCCECPIAAGRTWAPCRGWQGPCTACPMKRWPGAATRTRSCV